MSVVLGALVLAVAVSGIVPVRGQEGSDPVNAETPAPAWSASLTVGQSGSDTSSLTVWGYSAFAVGGLGELGEDTFSSGDQTIEVKAVSLQSGHLLLSLLPEPAGGFVLDVDGTGFASADATVNRSDTLIGYLWTAPELSWAKDDTVALSVSWVETVVVKDTTPPPTPTPTPVATAPPARPTGLSSEATHDSVSLTWDDPGDATITHYEVFRRDASIHAIGEFITLEENTGSAATTYTDESVEPGSHYVYRVKAVNAQGASPWSGFSKALTPVAPDPPPAAEDLAPSGLTAALAEGGVSLTWSAPAEDADSVSGYEILRGVGEGAFTTLVDDTESTATAYTDATANEAGETYAYQVKAIRGADGSEAFGQAQVQIPHDPVDLAPTGLTATLVEGGGAGLSWTAPAEDSGSVSGYEILRGVSGGTLTTLVADTGSSATAYSDATASQAGTSYAYRVIALRDGVKSQPSNEASVDLPEEAGSDAHAPTGLTATLAEGGGATLSWSAPAEDAGSVSGYEILRGVGEGAFTTLVDDIESTATAYTDATASEAGETYTYQVRAIRGEARSQASGQAQVQIPHDADDLAPTGLTATLVEGGGVTLSWSAPAKDSGSVSGYEILRGVGAGAVTTLAADSGNTSTSYTDATATEAGETYIYQVKAIRGAKKSDASNQAVVAVPQAADGQAPSNLTAVVAENGGTTLSWSAPAEDADSVTGYEILRSVSGGTLATLVADSGNTNTTYTDATATTAGETYTYQVKAIRGAARSQASGEAAVQIPHDPADLAPTGLVVTLAAGGGYRLSWTAPAAAAGSITGYEILRAVGLGAFTTLVADTGNSATTHADASASQVGTSYRYRVIALRDGIKSQQSNVALVDPPVGGGVTLTCPATDTACSGSGPADLAVAEAAAGLHLSWNPPPAPTLTGAETTVLQYQIRRSPGDDDYALVTCVDADARSYLDDTAAAGGQYRYQVRATYFVNEACAALRDIDVDLTLGGTGYEPVDGLWSDGATLWASDAGNDRILAFRLSDGRYDSGNDIAAEDGSGPRGLWGRDGALWALAKSGSGSTPMALDGYSLADATFGDHAGRIILGHQADDSGAPEAGIGLWADAGTFWVTALQTSLLAYDWAESGTLTRNTAQELNPAISNSEFATSMWGDGTTMWIATQLSASFKKVTAIDWPAGTADTGKDIGLRRSHKSVGGMWSDGEIIWIASGNDDLFAYPLSNTRQHSAWSRSNRAAVVTVTPATAVVAGAGTLSPKVKATDPENDDLTYAWTSDNGGAFRDAAVAKWTAPAATANDQTITLTLTVTDAHSETATATVLVTVPASTSGAPSVAATALPTIVDGGEVVSLGGTAADPDGDGLSYAWTSSGGGTFGKAVALDTTWTAPAATTAEQRITLSLTATDDSSEANSSVSTLVVIVRAELRNRFLRQTVTNASGRPVVLVSAEGGGILAADPSRIADADGLPYTGRPDSGIDGYVFSYQWFRVDGSNETTIGADSQRYQLVDADYGKRIKVQVSFTDRGDNPEVVTSVPFGPLVRPAPLPSPSTLVGNTGQSPSASATITGTYAMRFKLGTYGQGYEISSVDIDLAAAPLSLSVSLWTGGPPGRSDAGTRRAKLFDFENPAAFQVGLNEFTAPAGAFAHQNVDYWIVLSDFGSQLSITETTSDAEDAGGETGASLSNTARSGTSSVLRLAVEGSKRTSGILAANFAQPAGGQEIISVGDVIGWAIDLGGADRYLIRGVTFSFDDTTPDDGGFDNPWWLRSDSMSGDRQFNLVHTRDVNGLPVWTAPQGATVAGSKTYVFDWADINETKPGGITRIGAVLTRAILVTADADGQSDKPTAPGVSLVPGRRLSGIDNAGNTVLMAVYGVQLDALVQNLGQTDNSYVSAGASNTVVSQGFTTGSVVDGYPLVGIGVEIEGSGTQIPDDSSSVSVSLHADSSGKPGAKLFDLLSPTEYAAGLSFFEAPRGTVLDPSTSYVLVWTYHSGAGHRLRRTSSNGEDSGKQDGFSIADAYSLGADVDNLSVDSGGNSLEIAVYGTLANKPARGRPLIYPSADGAGILLADAFGIEDPNGVLVYSAQDEAYVRNVDWSYQWIRVDGETEIEIGADSLRYQPVEADLGQLIKVRVAFTDQDGYEESVTGLPFGPIAEAGPSAYPSTLVSNTDQVEPLERLKAFGLHSNNGGASGTWSDGTTIWVANDETSSLDRVFAYTLADGQRDSSKDITSGTLPGSNAQGICSDGTTLYVANHGLVANDMKIFAFRLSDLSRDSGKDITYHSSNTQPRGIWCDANTVWAINDGLGTANKIYAYRISNGSRDTSKEFDTLNAANNRQPQGLWSDGTTMWVSDPEDDRVYAYKMSDESRDSEKDIDLDSANAHAEGLWSDGVTMLVVDDGDDKFYAYELPGAEEPSEGPVPETATITQQYAHGFRLGDHGQGYELSSVSIDLAAVPSSLTVSLWVGSPPGYELGGVPAYQLFDFANPGAFKVGLNTFTAPAGAFAYQNVEYYIVLSGFGSSLQVKETMSDAEDGGGEPGAILFDDARVRALSETGHWGSPSSRAGVLRLVIEGSKRTSGILASNYAQVLDEQEVVSKGDEGGMPITLGAADRYLIRGFSWLSDDTTPANGGIYARFDLRSGWTTHSDGKINDAGDKWYILLPTRFEAPGINVWTAPQGATVAGNDTYMVYNDWQLRPRKVKLTRFHGTSSDNDDIPTAPGATLFDAVGDLDGRPLMAFLGEPLVAMVQNLGQTDNSGVSLGGILANKVLSQGFTTGSDAFGYRLQGIGVNIEGSNNNFPDDSTSVSVAVHADSSGQPGDKLFDLLSPTEYAAGHSFFEAPPGTYLDPNTAYVLVWRYISGTTHRLQRTSVDAEDAGARSGAGIANAYYLGADLGSLSAASGGDALEIAVYTEVLDTAPGEFILVVDLPTEALVSNIGQTSESGGYEVSSAIRYAPSFGTGSEAVTLDSVELDVATAPTTSSDISVAIHTASGSNPGSKLYDLSNPSTIGTGVQTFTAPAGARLEANATYYVVISSSNSTVMKMRITRSDSEDAGGADGWTIGNDVHFRRNSWMTDTSVIQIRVNGHTSVTTAPTEVEPDWALVPEEVSTDGGVFRLLFLSSTTSGATSTDIRTYNTRVQTRAAAGHAAIRDYSAGFRAVASTAAVDARDNTATTGTSVPIYWLGGTRLAHNYGDFYDGTWDDEQNVSDESGLAYIGLGNPQAVWTGSNDSGVEHFHSGVSRALGASTAERGGINNPARGVATPNPLYGNNASANTDRFPLYALSEVFTVGPNPARITDLAITSNPRAGGIYRTGETIEVTATFGAPVRVEGAPRIKLRLGLTEQRDRWAEAEEVQVVDLVKNTGQSSDEGAHLTLNLTRIGQAFTTGSAANGYELSSIAFVLGVTDASTAGGYVSATLNEDDNGEPGDALCTLDDPARFHDGVAAQLTSFAAPAACPELQPNTTYFAVIEHGTEDDSVSSLAFAVTSSSNEDSGGEAGGSIANSWYVYASDVMSGFVSRNESLKIEVRGHARTTAGVLVPGQERVLVDNVVGNTTGSTEVLDSTTTKAAQAFTTGVHSDGYRLNAIALFMQLGNSATAGDHLTVTLNADSSGNPGNVLCTLDDPAVFNQVGLNTFDAPTTNPCPTLAANTTYFVVVERVDVTTTDARWLLRVQDVDETGGSTAGWSIGDSSHSFASGSWSETDNEPYGITVNSATFLRASLQVPFSYTVQAADESDPDGIAVGLTAASDAVDLNGGAIKLAGTERSAVLGFAPFDSDDGHLVNWARPSLVDGVSAVDGRRLHLTFSEELNPDSTPPIDLFTVYLDGDPAVLSVATVAVAGRVVTLRLETALSSPVQALTVSYADPSAGDDPNAVEDREGNDAFAFDNRPLTNRFGLKAELLPDSPLIPEGLGIGAQFRLLFLTSTTRDATTTEIEDYNAFVQAAAAIGRADIREYGTGFFAVASTAAADARDNTATTGTGVPIYWLGGNKLADNNADFYDGSWDDEANPTDESGAATSTSAAWTGSGSDGTKGVHTDHGSTVLGGGDQTFAAFGQLNSAAAGPLSGMAGWREITRKFYAVSEVFTVVSPAAVSKVEISSDPGSDGNYATGDDIAVAFTFGEEVDVSGNPRIRIRLGDDASTERTAYFDSAVLVKNTAQAPFSGSPLNAATPKFAQRFSTGAIPGGYQLSEIGIRFHTIEDPASADGQLTVTVNRDNNGAPGSVRCTLTNPASLRSNVLSSFDSTGCSLAVETDYYVVIERTTVSAETIAVWTTASADEDALRLEDWSMADSGHVYRTSRGSWSAGGAPFVIKVGGNLSDPDIYQPRVLISNTGQTVRGEFSPIESRPRFAGNFTTGRSRFGYRLQSIGFAMGAITDPSTAGDKIRVTLHATQGLPGYELCVLTPPDSFSENAVNRFGASRCPALAPGTTYYVVFGLLTFDASEDVQFSTTGSLLNDAAAAGWSRERFILGWVTYVSGLVGWDITEFGPTFRIEVNGRVLLPAEQPEPPKPPEQPRKQVANTGQTGQVGSALTSTRSKHAQAFTTGGNANGYRLARVGLRLGTVSDKVEAPSQTYVTLHEGGNVDPGAQLCRPDDQVNFLTNTTMLFHNLGSCPKLEPNTTYFVVIERHTVDSDTIELSVTASDNEDTARPGWSIADDSRVFGTAWSSGGGSSLAIDVRAVDLPSEEELRPSGAVEELVAGPVGKLVGSHLGILENFFILETDVDQIAQSFTTGANADGYRLSSLGWLTYNTGNLASFKNAVTVSLKTSDGGNPGDTLCRLGDVQLFSIASEPMWRFYPPSANACPALEPNTTYFGVMADVPGDAITARLINSASGAEDEDSEPGWSIADISHFVLAGETQWKHSAVDQGATAWAFEVRGAELALPPSVANFDQPLDTLFPLEFVGTKVGQAFTTGAHERGYALSSIGMDIANWRREASQLAVTLNADNNGVPGEALCTLNSPADLSTPQTLDAPSSCPTLTSQTTYFAVAELLVPGSEPPLAFPYTASDAEDSDSAPDWSIADGSALFNRVQWSRHSTVVYYIEVKAVPLQASLQVPSTPVVFSYTVEPSDESGPDGVAVGDPDADGNTIELNGGAITIRSSGETFPLDFTALFADAGHLVNWARPTLVSAATSKDGKRVRLTFSEDLGRSGRPPTSLFTLKVDGAEAALTGIGIDAAVVDSETWTVDAPLEAPQSWAFTPSGLSPGDQFRLLFLTSTKRDATSTEIDDYNSFVQTAAAASHAEISHGFYAVASTADDDARDNTKTTGTGVPIYWLGGNKLADDYADFYDGTWDDENNVTDESGSAYTDLVAPHNVWTGSDDSGTGYTSAVLGSEVRLSRVLGTSASGGAGLGSLNIPAGIAVGATIPNPIYGGNEDRTSNSAPLYALSLPFVVAAAAVEPPSADETQLVGSVVTLELVTPLTSSSQVVTVSYDDPRLQDDINVIEDLVGNDARSFTKRPVLNRFAYAPAAVEVPADWPLVPEGLPAGASFRLLFVTSTERDASSAYIEDYDDFVQNAAAGGHESDSRVPRRLPGARLDGRDRRAGQHLDHRHGRADLLAGRGQAGRQLRRLLRRELGRRGEPDRRVRRRPRPFGAGRLSVDGQQPQRHGGDPERRFAGPGRRDRHGGDRGAGQRQLGHRPVERRGRIAQRRASALRALAGLRGRTAGGADRIGDHPARSGRGRPVPAAVPQFRHERRDLVRYYGLQHVHRGRRGRRSQRDRPLQRRLPRGRLDGRYRRSRQHLDDGRGRADLLARRRQAGRRLRRLLRPELGRRDRRDRRDGQSAPDRDGRRLPVDGQQPRRRRGGQHPGLARSGRRGEHGRRGRPAQRRGPGRRPPGRRSEAEKRHAPALRDLTGAGGARRPPRSTDRAGQPHGHARRSAGVVALDGPSPGQRSPNHTLRV